MKQDPEEFTLLDAFAMCALVGLLSGAERGKPYRDEEAARYAYDQADAMIKEREERLS